jgi:hypothetical protein
MSIEENKLPPINTNNHIIKAKLEKEISKKTNNIHSIKIVNDLDTTSKNLTFKKYLLNSVKESPKLKLRSTSTNCHNITLKKNYHKNILSSSHKMNPVKYYRSYYKKNASNSKSKSKSKSKSRSKNKNINIMKSLDDKTKINNNIVDESNELKTYYYRLIKNGNDISTIKRCFEHRENWQLAPQSYKYDKINLIWAPLSCQINYNEINKESNNKINTFFNHYEYHTQISNKLKMFQNLLIFCEDNKYDLFAFVPLTILIEYQSTYFLHQFASFSYIFNNINYFLSENGCPKDNKKKYRNYFYIDNNLDNRIGLRTTVYIPSTHYSGKNFWLIKAMNLNRGLAIKIIDSVEACENIIRYYYQGGIYKNVLDSEKMKEEENKDTNKKVYFELPKIYKNGQNNNFKNNHEFCLYRQIDYYNLLKNNSNNFEKKKHYQSKKIILQKYIEKPLLYRGRKFDVRIWVLLSHDMKVYIFKEGHLKATSTLFSLEDKNFFVHLTNYSVQKYCDDFGKEEIGNEISFDEFEKSLKEEYNLEINVRKFIMNKIKKIVEISMKSVKKSININNRKGCFEIFGYDFMFDEELTPFLIEINTNPGLEISSPLISKLIPRMIDDAFRLTIDLCFETIYSSDRYGKDGYISPFHVEGYSDYENMFELIVNLNEK